MPVLRSLKDIVIWSRWKGNDVEVFETGKPLSYRSRVRRPIALFELVRGAAVVNFSGFIQCLVA